MPSATAAAAPYQRPSSDFNGDGFQDLVVSSRTGPKHLDGAGHVTVLYGSKRGLRSGWRQGLDRDSPGVPGASQAGSNFGVHITTGDFNGDRYSDLGVSAATEHTSAGADAGTVTVFFGGAKGLGRAMVLTEPQPGAHGHFGTSLAATDINRDGRTELVIGGGAQASTYIAWFQARPGRPVFTSLPEPQSYYTLDVGAGDVTGDGYGDVIVTNARGKMALYLGGPNGPGPRSAERQLSASSIALGDINRDGRADLVVGEVGWGRGGAIHIFLGTPAGLSKRRTITQNTPGVPGRNPGPSGFSDEFGSDVAVGDITGDGYADLAVGVPESHIGRPLSGYGAVVIFRGGPNGVSTSRVQQVHQDTPGVPGVPEAGDRFGGAVALIDHNRDGKADLTVGAWGEDHSTGGIWLLSGTKTGIATARVRVIGPKEVAAPVRPAPDFGFRLAK